MSQVFVLLNSSGPVLSGVFGALTGLTVLWDMKAVWFLGVLSLVALWKEQCCEAMTLNSTLLRPVLEGKEGGGASGCVHSLQGRTRRRRRSWVWNQFFVLEEYTGDEPLYVGKVRRKCIIDHSDHTVHSCHITAV